jgi:predicted nucleic-acid-binding protein
MTTKELEKEIVKAIRIEAEIPLASNVGYYNLIKLVKKLFKEYRGDREYITSTINGLLKGDK